jgi:hypothetical protein
MWLGSPDQEMIREAIPPGLTRLERPHQRVAVNLPVPAGMSVLRVVAATDLATEETSPQVHPFVSSGDALIAHVALRSGLALEASGVITGSRHEIGAAEARPTVGRPRSDSIQPADQPAREAAAVSARETNTGNMSRR